jgi:hypothetical protein
MSERSERIINTGFGEAFYAEPFVGGPCRATPRSLDLAGWSHR